MGFVWGMGNFEEEALLLYGWCLTGPDVVRVLSQGVLMSKECCLRGPDVARVVSQGVLMLQSWCWMLHVRYLRGS